MSVADHVANELLAASGRRCCLCRSFLPIQLQVHHIVPREDGGTDERDNLIPLCLHCHNSVHAKTQFTRSFSAGELKQLRDETFRLVAEGKLTGDTQPAAGQLVDLSLRQTQQNVTLTFDDYRESLEPAAVEILLAVAQSENGHFIWSVTHGGTRLDVQGVDLIDSQNARRIAEYRAGVDQLENCDLIEATGMRHEVFRPTHRGYQIADALLAKLSQEAGY